MLLFLFVIYNTIAQPWQIRGPNGVPTTETVHVEDVFSKAPLGWAENIVLQDKKNFVKGSKSTLEYIQRNKETDPIGVHPGMLGEYGITIEQIESTIVLLSESILKHPEKLKDAAWWESNFDLYLWNADAFPRPKSYQDPNQEKQKKDNAAVKSHEGQIRLTKYVVYEVDGSTVKTDKFSYALWKVPTEEENLSDSEATARKDLLRLNLTRQQILSGALQEKYHNKAQPLIWLERANVHEAIMQGTIAVRTQNGEIQWFNVHRSNNRPYKHGFPMEEQERYWYFRRVKTSMGWGWQAESKIELQPYVSVAGDINNLGLGKVFWLQEENTVRLVILSDTGGAFQPNLSQLDWFVGVVQSKDELYEKCAQMPPFVQAGILIAKSR